MSHNHYLIDKYEKKINFGLDKFNNNPDLPFVHGIAIHPRNKINYIIC